MLYAEVIGKTIADVTEEEMVGKDAAKCWISWRVTTLHFTDNTSYSFTDNTSDVYDVGVVDSVYAGEIRPQDLYRDDFGEWRRVNEIQVLAGGVVSVNGDEYGPADKIERKSDK